MFAMLARIEEFPHTIHWLSGALSARVETAIKQWRCQAMLVAYEDLGFKIKDIPGDDARVPPHPIATHANAVQIRDAAMAERPDVRWEIVGNGPWGVYGKL
jgi:hypothetical protein